MNYRALGRTGLQVSETSFGAWAIGGASYGRADRAESLRALARAEELGCNLVDTAMVYGESEAVLGQFLRDRRDKWLVSTKYSGQPAGLEATLDAQLLSLGTEHVDVYLVHWVPAEADHAIYDGLDRARRSGKARFVGFSAYNIHDIRRVVRRKIADVIMLPFSVLDPDPFLAMRDTIRSCGVGIMGRSCLKEGFLTGKFTRESTFDDPNDQRQRWTREQVSSTAEAAEQFRFLEGAAGSMGVGAARYPLAFPEISTVTIGTRSEQQAEINFGTVPGGRLPSDCLDAIHARQRRLRLFDRRGRFKDRVRSIFG